MCIGTILALEPQIWNRLLSWTLTKCVWGGAHLDISVCTICSLKTIGHVSIAKCYQYQYYPSIKITYLLRICPCNVAVPSTQ